MIDFPNRIGVIGPPGSGKSHLARIIAAELGMLTVELDSVFWLPGWGRRDRDEFLAELRKAAGSDGVIIVGNYSTYATDYWTALSTVVWLDLPRRVTYPRLLLRTVADFVSRREVQPGCPQTLRSAAELLKEGIAARGKIRPAVYAAVALPGHQPVVHRLRSRAAVDAVVAGLRTAAPPEGGRP